MNAQVKVIHVERKNPIGGAGYWKVGFDYGSPTDPTDPRTRYHWQIIRDERGKHPVKPYEVGEMVNADDL
jgi:hypothetical protein